MGFKINATTGAITSPNREAPDISVSDRKANMIESLKLTIQKVIYVNAPVYKQQNIANGLLLGEDAWDVKKWIMAGKETCETKELSITDSTTHSGLDVVTIDYDSLYTLTDTNYTGDTSVAYEMTLYDFRLRFTMSEKRQVENFENSALSSEHKSIVRSILEDFKRAGDVNLYSIGTEVGLQTLVNLGYLLDNRKLEIINPITINEITKITTVADSLGNLAGKYFLLSDLNENYYVWFDVDNGSSDPVVADKVGIEVDISENDTANDVAAKLQQKLNLTNLTDCPFSVSVSNNEVTIICITVGAPLTSPGVGDSGFTVTVLQSGGIPE